jgi:hypothetical protein
MTGLGRRGLMSAACIASACSAGEPLGPASNRAPQVRSVTVTPATVAIGGSAAVRVDAFDPDGDPMFFHYRAEAGTVTIEPADPSRAVYRNDGVTREQDRIVVTVIDASHAESAAEAQVPLQGNRSPTVRITGLRACHPTCRLALEARATDPDDGDRLVYQWTGCAEGTLPSAHCTLVNVGLVTATVTVLDGRGGVASDTVGLEGTNAAPIVTGGQTIRGTSARLVVEQRDPDNDFMVCGWLGSCQCIGIPDTNNKDCLLPPTLAQCYERFACTDSFGATGETRFDLIR